MEDYEIEAKINEKFEELNAKIDAQEQAITALQQSVAKVDALKTALQAATKYFSEILYKV